MTISKTDALAHAAALSEYIQAQPDAAPATGTTSPPPATDTGTGTTSTPEPTTTTTVPTPTPTSPPIVLPAAPKLSSPTILTTTHRLSKAQAYAFANMTGALGLPYSAKDGVHIPSVSITDQDLSGSAGVLRAQTGIIDQVTMQRLKLLKGQYDPGVICGLFHVGHADIGTFLMEDIDYEREEYVGSPGDVYAAVFTGGGHDDKGNTYGSCQSGVIRRVRSRGAFTNYATGVTAYKNSDHFVAEKTFKNILIDQCDWQGAADAIIDRKSPNTRVQNTIIGDGRENMKTWTDAIDGFIWSRMARHCHHLIVPNAGVPIHYRSEHTVYEGTDPQVPLYEFQRSGGTIQIDIADLERLPPKQVLAIANTSAFAASKVTLNGKTYAINKGTVYL